LTDEDTALREAINKAEKSKSDDIKRIAEKAMKAVNHVRGSYDKVVEKNSRIIQRNKNLSARITKNERKTAILEKKYKEACLIISESKFATEVAIKEAARLRKACENLIFLCSEHKYSTDVAVTEAAKYRKAVKKRIKPSVKEQFKESRDPKKAISVKKTKLTTSEQDKKNEKLWASARSGEHSIRGFI
jgi:hypothetical protein